ncbi:HAMP domain-containing sensor histidine kinase [Paenibacillus campi]|uniref:sensor histidine kinase n=1 Tax=Paenibacillus campi TaxID=3106031 RepID=UPI002AFED679|nr:HAMP domain-containing sensor histidine kinase [Paenibacillus sp. SGZ-1014]
MHEDSVTKWKNKWLKRPRAHYNIFQQTQRSLTWKYSLVLIAFLLLFVLILYGLLYYLLIFSPTVDVHETIEQKIHALKVDRQQDDDDSLSQYIEYYTLYDTYGMGNVLIEPTGTMKTGTSIYSASLKTLIQHARAQGKRLPTNRNQHLLLKGTAIRLPEQRPDKDDLDDKPDRSAMVPQTIRMLITGEMVYDGSKPIGMLYVGKDVTGSYHQFYKLMLGLGAAFLLFCALAVYFSYRMAAKAMVPILASYERQRKFTADASHELRTPLSVLLSSIDTLQMEDAVEHDPFAAKVVQNMKEEVRRMIQLSGSLLTLARSDSGHSELNVEQHDLQAEAARTLASIRPLAEAKQISLHYDAPAALLLRCDAERIRQLLIILLDNAVKYTSAGGHVSLTLEQLVEKPHSILIRVSDNGIGIPDDDQRHIFDRFYRVDKSRTRRIEGYGLGLSIARWIVEAHQGTIEVESTLGAGSTFTVRLPA